MKTFCNIYAGLMALSIIIGLFTYPIAVICWCAVYGGVMFALETGKRKSGREKKPRSADSFR